MGLGERPVGACRSGRTESRILVLSESGFWLGSLDPVSTDEKAQRGTGMVWGLRHRPCSRPGSKIVDQFRSRTKSNVLVQQTSYC